MKPEWLKIKNFSTIFPGRFFVLVLESFIFQLNPYCSQYWFSDLFKLCGFPELINVGAWGPLWFHQQSLSWSQRFKLLSLFFFGFLTVFLVFFYPGFYLEVRICSRQGPWVFPFWGKTIIMITYRFSQRTLLELFFKHMSPYYRIKATP